MNALTAEALVRTARPGRDAPARESAAIAMSATETLSAN